MTKLKRGAEDVLIELPPISNSTSEVQKFYKLSQNEVLAVPPICKSHIVVTLQEEFQDLYVSPVSVCDFVRRRAKMCGNVRKRVVCRATLCRIL